MFEKLFSGLEKHARPKTILILLALIIGLSFITSYLYGNITKNAPPKTLNFGGYNIASADQVYSALSLYGSSGRRALWQFGLWDYIPAILWPTFFSLSIIYIYQKLLKKKSSFIKWAVALSFTAMALDFVQDAIVVMVGYAYPQRLDLLTIAAGYLAITYATIDGIMMLLIVGGLISYLVRRFIFKKIASS